MSIHHPGKKSRILSAQQYISKPVNKPLSFTCGARPGSAKQWFEACNHRKNEEALKFQKWESAVADLKKQEWQAKFYTTLSDSRNRTCDNDWKELQEKQILLLKRRQRLRRLLKEDEESYEKERESKCRKSDVKNGVQAADPEVEMLKRRLDDLKRKNEEERRKISDRLSYEVWKKNNSQIRQMESDRMERFVQEAWVDQAQWKEDQRKKAAEERKRAEMEAMEKIRIQEEEELKVEEERKAKRDKWKEELKENLRKIREKEQEEESLKTKEDALQREKLRINELLLKRERILEARKRKELELFWARQHQLKLKKKALIIQEELIQDQLLIENFLKGFSDASFQDEINQNKEEAKWMRNVLEEQKRLEKLREKEYEFLFSEEARLMWQKREAEWEKEQKARDGLMKDVLTGLQKQINDKMEGISTSINSSKETRIALIDRSKETQRLIAQGEKEAHEEKSHKTTSRRMNEFEFDQSKGAKYERVMQEKMAAEHKEEISRLEEEMKQLWKASYIPPRHGRKKVAWLA